MISGVNIEWDEQKPYKPIFNYIIMEINIIKEENYLLGVEIGNLTIAELLRAYINKESGVEMAAWKREHPTKKPILKVQGKNPKKLIEKAISAVEKDLDKIEKDFKSMK
jgi:DNA-directed RNA polymerase subunit L